MVRRPLLAARAEYELRFETEYSNAPGILPELIMLATTEDEKMRQKHFFNQFATTPSCCLDPCYGEILQKPIKAAIDQSGVLGLQYSPIDSSRSRDLLL